MERIQTELEEERRTVSTLEKAKKRLESKIDELQSQLEQESKKVAAYQKEYKKAKKELNLAKWEIDASKSNTSNEKDVLIRKTETDLEQAKQEIESKNREISSLQEQKKRLEEELEQSATSKNQDWEKKLKKAQQDLDKANQEIQQKNSKIKKLKKLQLELVSSPSGSTPAASIPGGGDTEKLNKELKELKKTNKKLETQLKKLQEEHEDELETTKKQIDTFKKKLDDEKQKSSRLEQETLNNAQTFERQIRELRAKITSLESVPAPIVAPPVIEVEEAPAPKDTGLATKAKKEFERKIRTLENSLREEEEKRAPLEVKIKKLDELGEQSKQKINSLQQQYDTAVTTITRLEKELKLTKERLETDTTKAAHAESRSVKLNLIESEIKELKEDLEKEINLRARMEREKISLEAIIADRDQKDLAEAKLQKDWRKEKEEILFRCSGLETRLEVEINQKDIVQRDRDALQVRLDELEAQLQDSGNKVSGDVMVQLGVLEQQLEAEVELRLKAEKSLPKLLEELDQLKKKNREIAFSVDDFKKKLDETEFQLETQTKYREKLEAEKNNLLRTVDDLQQQNRNLMDNTVSSTDKVKREIQYLKEKVSSLSQEKETLEYEKGDLQRQFNHIKNQLEDKELVLLKYQRNIEDLKTSDIGSISSQLEAERKLTSKLKKDIETVNENLQEQVSKWLEEMNLRTKLERQKKKLLTLVKDLKKTITMTNGEELETKLEGVFGDRAVQKGLSAEIARLMEAVQEATLARIKAEEICKKARHELKSYKKEMGVEITKSAPVVEEETEEEKNARLEAEQLAQKSKIDVIELFNSTPPPPPAPVDDGKGEYEIYGIEESEEFPMPGDKYGQFFSGNCFVILYTNEPEPENYVEIVYVWIGRHSPQQERKVAQAYAKSLLESQEYTILYEGKETPHFLTIFQGKLMIHQGRLADYVPNQPSLYEVRGGRPPFIRTVQCPLKARSMNTQSIFIIQGPQYQYIWTGRLSSPHELEVATEISHILRFDRTQLNILEGSETAEFWEILQGRDKYATGELIDEETKVRFFKFSLEDDQVKVSEEAPFCQGDLGPKEVVLLDAYNEMYIWIGSDIDDKEKLKKIATDTAMEYAEKVPDHRPRPPQLRVLLMKQGHENIRFTRHFQAWEEYESARARGLTTTATQLTKPVLPKMEDILAEYNKKYTYEKLKDRDSLPATVEQHRLEDYLNDNEFPAVFGMTREEFMKAPKWKKDGKKKAAGLF